MGHQNHAAMRIFQLLSFTALISLLSASCAFAQPKKERLFILDTNSVATTVEYFSPYNEDVQPGTGMTRYYVLDARKERIGDEVQHYDLFTNNKARFPKYGTHEDALMTRFMDLPTSLPEGLEYIVRVKLSGGKEVLFIEYVKKGEKPKKPGTYIALSN